MDVVLTLQAWFLGEDPLRRPLPNLRPETLPQPKVSIRKEIDTIVIDDIEQVLALMTCDQIATVWSVSKSLLVR